MRFYCLFQSFFNRAIFRMSHFYLVVKPNYALKLDVTKNANSFLERYRTNRLSISISSQECPEYSGSTFLLSVPAFRTHCCFFFLFL